MTGHQFPPGKQPQRVVVTGRWVQLGPGWRGAWECREASDEEEISKEVLFDMPDLGVSPRPCI